ncbi:MAG: glycosyltransferase family 4 protein [Anaerolineae bacterium]|nr:glycosyltransferase family 4 protein [Anaerolineae bacterium]
MKIGVLTHNYPRYRGDFSGRFVEALSEELVAQGHQVTVLAPWDAAYARTPSDHRVALELYRYAPRADWHQLGYMRTMRADVALRRMTYLLAPGMFAAGVRAVSAWAGRERPDVLHAHWALPNGFIGAVAARRHGIPLAVSIPGSDATVAAANPIFRRMARYAFDTARLITANSTALRDVAVNDLGADPAKFDLIAYGVDPNALRPDSRGAPELRAALGIPPDAVVFLAVGRMVYKKGFDRLLRALALLKTEHEKTQQPADNLQPSTFNLQPAHAVFIGEGDLWAEWQALGRELGLGERLHWVGNVPSDRIGVYYNMADALVMPSVTRPADGLNVTVLDAMSCARPVIGTDAAGNELAIRDSVNGLLTPEGDDAALARALATLAGDPDRRARMGAEGRRMIERELGWPHLARRYVAHFERMTQGVGTVAR